MQNLTFENLLPRAQAVFHDAWISEGTPEECKYYREYFEKYPNKGDYETFYNRCLKKHACTLLTSWDYEEPEYYATPEELLKAIEDEEAAWRELCA